MEQSQSHFSQVAHDRLQGELKKRSGPDRLEISERIERAREMGDIKENADYDAAKNEQGLNEARIRQLEQMLRDAVIIESSDADVVGPGIVATIVIGGEDPQDYLIGSIEERNEKYVVLSTSSALGQELLGKRAGDEGAYELPRGGKSETFKILAIRPAD